MASQSSTQKPSEPGPRQYITTHDASGKAVFSRRFPEALTPVSMPETQIYDGYKSFSPSIAMTDEADLDALESHHGAVDAPFFPRQGSWIRYCEWAPNTSRPVMHRTETVDLGVVFQGEVEAVLESGETRRLRVGDSIVQRGTMHAWRNPSQTETAKMFFVTQGAPPVKVQGQEMREDLSAVGS